jgi:hypothetical protein
MKFDKTKLKITPASFRESKELERSMGKALSKSSLNFGLDSVDTKNVLNSQLSENTVGEFLKSFLNVAVSREVEDNLFICCKRAAYDNNKINETFFEEIENRKLYYSIMIEIIKVNVVPFIESLSSQFEGLLKKISTTQK